MFKQEPLKRFLSDDSIRDLLGFSASTVFEEYKLLPNPVDILCFDNISLGTDFAQGINFKGR